MADGRCWQSQNSWHIYPPWKRNLQACHMMAIEKTSTTSFQATTLKDCNMEEASQNEQPIHSGHFMITNVHDPSQEDDEYDDDSEEVKPDMQETGFDFNSANKSISNFYSFGQNASLSIDDSLTKLFDCMSLAYRYVSSCQHSCTKYYPTYFLMPFQVLLK